jgi:hypothetical protein
MWHHALKRPPVLVWPPQVARILALIALTGLGCERTPAPSAGVASASQTLVAIPAPTDPPPTASSPRSANTPNPVAPASPPTGENAGAAKSPDGRGGNARRWTLLGDEALSAPTQAVVTPHGLVLVTRENEPLTVRLAGHASGNSWLERLPADRPPGPFGRGPVFAGRRVYWVRDNTLFAQSQDAPRGPVERLTEDVYPGSRLSVLTEGRSASSATAWLAYIATGSRGAPIAKLWFSNPHQGTQGTLVLTEAGASAQSVQLTRSPSGEHYAVSLEARLGMTTVHARPLIDTVPPSLGSDRVIWVGGTAQSETELTVADVPGHLVVLTALERDISHFGLAVLSFADLAAEPTVSWSLFPNGLARMTVATATACGRVWALFSRPSSAQPRAPVELVLGTLSPTGLGELAVLAEAPALRDVSMAGVSGGVLVHYVTDTQTRVLSLRCNRD